MTTAIFERVIRPTRSVSFETLSRSDAIAAHPELKAVFTAYDHAKQAINERYPTNELAREFYEAHLKGEFVRKLDAGILPQVPQREQDAGSALRGPGLDR